MVQSLEIWGLCHAHLLSIVELDISLQREFERSNYPLHPWSHHMYNTTTLHGTPNRAISISNPLWWNPLAEFSELMITGALLVSELPDWVAKASRTGEQRTRVKTNLLEDWPNFHITSKIPKWSFKYVHKRWHCPWTCSPGSHLSQHNESAFYKSWAWSKWKRVSVRKINGLYHPAVDYKLLIVWISVWCLELNWSPLPQKLISTDIVHYFSNTSPRYISPGQIPKENNNFCCRYLRAVIITVAN